ncbi:MAG TPA: addiction module protein [Pirellulales bacterium]|jgi:putative addiction module component (TIGR02574 family)|nr:addiction module protein [Pirellulales bacterium]
MHVSIESLGITRLSVGERLELIEEIWNSLPESVAPQDVPDSHLAELAMRRANAKNEPTPGKLWRDVIGPLEGSS